MLQSIPLIFQLKEQTKKVCKKERIERRLTVNTSKRGDQQSIRSHSTVSNQLGGAKRAENLQKELDPNNQKDPLLQRGNSSPRSNQVIEIERGGCCYNTREIFNYEAPT